MDHDALTTREALNRGLNFFGVAVLALLAASLIGWQYYRLGEAVR